MRTVSDLLNARAALLVSCRNCFREGRITARLLRDRFGLHRRICDMQWRCVVCGGTNVRLTVGGSSLAEVPKRHYRGLSYRAARLSRFLAFQIARKPLCLVS